MNAAPAASSIMVCDMTRLRSSPLSDTTLARAPAASSAPPIVVRDSSRSEMVLFAPPSASPPQRSATAVASSGLPERTSVLSERAEARARPRVVSSAAVSILSRKSNADTIPSIAPMARSAVGRCPPMSERRLSTLFLPVATAALLSPLQKSGPISLLAVSTTAHRSGHRQGAKASGGRVHVPLHNTRATSAACTLASTGRMCNGSACTTVSACSSPLATSCPKLATAFCQDLGIFNFRLAFCSSVCQISSMLFGSLRAAAANCRALISK